MKMRPIVYILAVVLSLFIFAGVAYGGCEDGGACSHIGTWVAYEYDFQVIATITGSTFQVIMRETYYGDYYGVFEFGFKGPYSGTGDTWNLTVNGLRFYYFYDYDGQFSYGGWFYEDDGKYIPFPPYSSWWDYLYYGYFYDYGPGALEYSVQWSLVDCNTLFITFEEDTMTFTRQ